MSSQGLRPRTPGRGIESPVDSIYRWYELIKLQFNIITKCLHILIKKSMKVRTWSKLRPKKTWGDRVNLTLQNRFSCTFKVLKTHELPEARPLEPQDDGVWRHTKDFVRAYLFKRGQVEHVLTMTNLKLKPSLYAPPYNIQNFRSIC